MRRQGAFLKQGACIGWHPRPRQVEMSPSGAIACLLAVRTAAPQLQQARNGSVIAIASMYGLVGQYERASPIAGPRPA